MLDLDSQVLARAGSALFALAAGGGAVTGSERSSKSSKFATGEAFAFPAAFPAVEAAETGFVFARRGAGEAPERLADAETEFDRRVAATSSSPASYSSKFLLDVESLNPPLNPPLPPFLTLLYLFVPPLYRIRPFPPSALSQSPLVQVNLARRACGMVLGLRLAATALLSLQ